MNNYCELMEYMKTIRPISTHSHFMPDQTFRDSYGLETLLNHSYCRSTWRGIEMDGSRECWNRYLERIKNLSFFVWLEKALQKIYQIDVPLRADTFDLFDRRIRESYGNKEGKHLKFLKDFAGYDRIILDAHWNPGYDNGHSGLFTPAFRIDSFLTGPNPKAVDCDGHNCRQLYGEHFGDFESFFRSTRKIIEEKVKGGAVALKCAFAYTRGLDIGLVEERQARAVFEKPAKDLTEQDTKTFQDYVFLELCRIAAQLDIPFQIHTGLARMYRSNAAWLQSAIEANPDTKFVIFHGSYPWMDDILGLAHVYPNRVYPDLVWLPLISSEAAVRFLSELIEVADMSTVCWGDDTFTPEESYGALLAVRHVLAEVLSKKIQKGYLSRKDAREIAANILHDNAARIYKIPYFSDSTCS